MTKTDEVLNLSEAQKLTGFSATKFNYEPNKKLLAEGGADVEGVGKEWKIPVSTLIAIGWLDEDGNAVKKSSRKTTTTRTRRDPLEVLQDEVAKAEADIDRYKVKLAEAQQKAKDAKKRYEAYKGERVATAKQEIEEKEAEIARLKALLGE